MNRGTVTLKTAMASNFKRRERRICNFRKERCTLLSR